MKCEICGKEFENKKSLYGHLAFCNKPKEECVVCHKLIRKSSIRRHYNTHEKYKFCLNCGKELTTFSKFCSQSCAAKYNNTKRKQIRLCECCGNELTYKQKRFCSLACSRYKTKETERERYLNGEMKTTISIRKMLINDYGNKCSICGTSEWCGKQLVLIVDHINGNSEDNFPLNLRLLCPNCDSQTDTFKGKNKGKGRYSRRIRYMNGESF